MKYIESQTIDDTTRIWRYMDFTSFHSLLLTRKLFFKRLDKYTDQLKGTLPEETKKALLDFRSKHGDAPDINEAWTDRYTKNVESNKKLTLSSSWSIGDSENYAMWKIYLRGSHEGIAISTTVGKLIDSLVDNSQDMFIGKVNYEPFGVGLISQQTVST